MKLETSLNGISGKIESIIKYAEDKIFLISPYIQLEKSVDKQWDVIKKALHFALKNDVPITVIARKPDKKYAVSPEKKFQELRKAILYILGKIL